MYVKPLAFAIAAAIGAMSVHAFAEPATVAAPQVAMVNTNLVPHETRQLISKTPLSWPKYVPQTREAKVVVRYTIEADGSVDHVEAVFGPHNPAFAEAARQAVSGWTYAPASSATPNVEAVAYFHAAQ
jgi:TonB family protein